MGCRNSTPEAEKALKRDNSKQIDKTGVEQKPKRGKTKAICSEDYALVDQHARKAPASLKSSAPNLVAYLSKPSKEPRMIARAIFVWISENIAYDTDGYFGRTRRAPCDAESVMRGGKSVCEGYANVMELLCREAGIAVKKLSGFSKGLSYSAESPFTTSTETNHAWNAIQLGRKWFLVDSTWGAGHTSTENHRFQKKFDDFYFLTDPKQFVYSHFPYMNGDMKESLKWQLLKRPVKLDEFNKRVLTKPAAFKVGVEPVSHKEGVISMKQGLKMSFRSVGKNDVSYSTTLMYKEGNMLIEKPRYIFEQIKDGLFKVKIRPHKTGTFRLTIFGKSSKEEGTLPQLMEYTLKCDRASKETLEYPHAYMQAQVDRCILKKPLQYKLKNNTTVDFHIISPHLSKVMINNIYLEKHGSSFKGPVKTGSRGHILSVFGSRDTSSSCKLGGLYKFEVV